jgi:hypothetical protein
MSSLKHNHNWDLIWSIGDRAVRRCVEPDCGIFESLAMDYADHSDNPYKWVPGNLWMDLAPIFIVTDTYEEYQEAASLVARNVGQTNIVNLDSVTKLQGIIRPTILFFGAWWESTIIRDPAFTYVLNRTME